MMDVIEKFRGDYFFLSNFAPCRVTYEGETYPTVEHAFQAAKTLNPQERKIFRHVAEPAEAKKWGKTVTLRPNWESIKTEIMYELVKQKFNNPMYKKKLMATGSSTLLEGNNHKDTFWGVYKGTGDNMLGKILMRVRDELKGEV